MLPLLLFNVISSLVVDKATDLATEHVESMIDDLLPDSAKKELDKTNAAFPMGKGSQGQELFKEMMIERGRIPGDARSDNSTFKELWDHYNSAPYDFEF